MNLTISSIESDDSSHNLTGMKRLEDRIALVLAETGWSKAELARQAGTSRTAPTDWTKGVVDYLSAEVARRISSKTKFSAMWLATGDGPMYKGQHDEPIDQVWPFPSIDESKVRSLSHDDRVRLDAALLFAAAQIGLDVAVKKDSKTAAA